MPVTTAKRWLTAPLRPSRRPLTRPLGVEPLEDRITPAGDYLEPNGAFDTAAYLGRFGAGAISCTNLSIGSATDVDWLSFRIDQTGADADYVKIAFTNSSGNLDLRLYAADKTLVGASTTTADAETISHPFPYVTSVHP